MHIYRVENENGEGPYTSSKWSDIAGKYTGIDMHNDLFHPTFYEDIGFRHLVREPNFFLSEHLFCFSSCEQLREWFSSREREVLEIEGFLVKFADIEYGTYQGNRQSLVEKSRFEAVEKLVIPWKIVDVLT